MTQTPASGPFELVTTPPMSSATILTSAAGLRAVWPVRAIPNNAARLIATIPRHHILFFMTTDLLRRVGHSQDILNRRLGCVNTAKIEGRNESYARPKPMSTACL